MKRLIALMVCMVSFASLSYASVWPKGRPKLVVFIVIDQFRADYLSRFQSEFRKDGFLALMKDGAYFPYGEYDILQSMTGPGHATVLTGSYPYQGGIPINEWYDEASHSSVYCVEDKSKETVGAPTKVHVGTSPKNLIATTVGDELKNAGQKSIVVSVALKDRAAILMGGHRADLAVWYDMDANKWVSSTYYLKDGHLPNWMNQLNGRISACDLSTSCGSELTVEAFKSLFSQFALGKHAAPDIVAVSFSSHDYAGHKHGPNSNELKDMTLSEDKAISEIRSFVGRSVPGGLKDVVFVLTGDHGIPPTPDYLADTGIASGRIDESKLMALMEERISKKFGKSEFGNWISYVKDFNFYLNEEAVTKAKADIKDVEREMKTVLLADPSIAQAFTRDDYEKHLLPPGQFERQINKTYFVGRSGHVIAIQKPFFINVSRNNADHMTGYVYDRTVPIIFSGAGIKGGTYSEKAEVVDIAPTLSFILGILPPALSEGKVLSQALK